MTAPETFFVPAAPGTKLAICHRESQRIDLLPLLGWVHPTGTESATGSPVVALGANRGRWARMFSPPTKSQTRSVTPIVEGVRL